LPHVTHPCNQFDKMEHKKMEVIWTRLWGPKGNLPINYVGPKRISINHDLWGGYSK
jgi:hypothetical protein